MTLTMKVFNPDGNIEKVSDMSLPTMNSLRKLGGPGVNGRVLAELRKYGKAEAEFESGRKIVFELTTAGTVVGQLKGSVG